MDTTKPDGRLDRMIGSRVQYVLARALEGIGARDEAREAYFAVLIIDGTHDSARRHWRALCSEQSTDRPPAQVAASPRVAFLPETLMASVVPAEIIGNTIAT